VTGIGAQIKAGILLLWEEIKSAPNLHILPSSPYPNEKNAPLSANFLQAQS